MTEKDNTYAALCIVSNQVPEHVFPVSEIFAKFCFVKDWFEEKKINMKTDIKKKAETDVMYFEWGAE